MVIPFHVFDLVLSVDVALTTFVVRFLLGYMMLESFSTELATGLKIWMDMIFSVLFLYSFIFYILQDRIMNQVYA
jgi:hypothetical protein